LRYAKIFLLKKNLEIFKIIDSNSDGKISINEARSLWDYMLNQFEEKPLPGQDGYMVYLRFLKNLILILISLLI
jgi:hypothetical protein